ncbi:DUF6444 domain-containing protein [Streptacidiphilus sp. P02-A3a]|uniref:DUF6444 domain-containing protein n=1 Tax=Streptacidiphilus sp. P02-A3a TaxID=2704468 RepID=UPI001CDD3659
MDIGLEALDRGELVAALATALARIEELTARVAELQDRLNRDSSNSSQPPSAAARIASRHRRRRRCEGSPGASRASSTATPGPPAARSLIRTR